ncbi:hypothetical protein R5R35_006764 [Gryllus longicercus]|uniref:Regulatory protein zeste n=1 Tax=Gryllus longicercus TaxID=2509291 RepID=A0AAN9V2I8_9ORTH
MNYEENGTYFMDRSSTKAKSTWFSAQDVCILADLVRSHSDAFRSLTNSPSRNEKKKVWEIIAQLLAKKTNVPRTTRQVQKKWSNLRSAVRRASRSSVGTSLLPHYFLPVVKYLEEEENDVCISQEIPEEEVDDLPQTIEFPQNSRQTYAMKIKHIQEQQEADVERFTVLKQIKLESGDASEGHEDSDVQEIAAVPETEIQEELQFSHVTLPNPETVHSDADPNGTATVWISEGENVENGAEQSESEDIFLEETQDPVRRNLPGNRKRLRPWPEYWEEKSDGDEARQMKLELLKAQLLLVQKETYLKEREIEKKDKEISLLDKELLKADLEIKFMKKKYLFEEMKMGQSRK